MHAVAIVPAYQAGHSVGRVVSDLFRAWPRELGDPAVLVVDDGSSDSTARSAEQAGATVIRHDRNRGKGAALKTGLFRARSLGAKVAVTVDADGQHPASEAMRVLVLPLRFLSKRREDDTTSSPNSTMKCGRLPPCDDLKTRGTIGDRRRMAMRYPMRIGSTRRKRMGGLTWRLRSNPRPRRSHGCVTP